MAFITREENYRRTHYVSLILEQHTTFSIFLNFAGNVARVLATGGVSLICEQVCKTKWMVFDIAKLNLNFVPEHIHNSYHGPQWQNMQVKKSNLCKTWLYLSNQAKQKYCTSRFWKKNSIFDYKKAQDFSAPIVILYHIIALCSLWGFH